MRSVIEHPVIEAPSANFGPRRGGVRPDLIVLHHTAMQTAEAALARLCDPRAEVSAHYMICARGGVWQLVDENMRAWHAGVGQWGCVTDVNSHSIGIELANTGAHPYPAPQMAVLVDLLVDLMRRWRIGPERVIGHSDMAPARKFDPGPRFDWRGLACQGVSVWPRAWRADAASPEAFLRDAATFGYRLHGDVTQDDILRAFRTRFRPGVSGALDPDDCARIADLAARFPVDHDTVTA